MDYLKISEIAHKCEVKRKQIAEYYRMVGANRQFTKEVVDALYSAISDMEKECTRLENSLRKLVNSNK